MVKKRLELTWVAAWGLLIGFIIGAATLIVNGHIRWAWVGLSAVTGWVLSGVAAVFFNQNRKKDL